ncbi:MAG: serine hydrolase domain-containing protein [Bacteroidales bacterium]
MLLLLVVISITAVIAMQRVEKIVSGGQIDDSYPNVITPLNHLLDNSMSSFEQTQRFDNDIRRFMRQWGIKGGSFALMYKDSLIYAKGYGYANIKDSIECNVNHLFRLASVSKLITAVTIMHLCEKNLISINSNVFGEQGVLNDSIFLNIPDKNVKKITIDNLLRHTGGFSNPIGDPAFNMDAVARVLKKPLPLTVNDMVIYAARNRLRATPGSYFNYSNLGYIVLSKVIEKVTGIEYEKYVKDSILAPIGCYDMYLGKNFSNNRKENEVAYYEVKEAEPVAAFDGSGKMTLKSNGGNDVTRLCGAGGWIASPVELLRFVASINNDPGKKDILSKQTINLMTEFSKERKPIGWASVTKDEWFRSGSMAGTSALIKRQKNGYTWIFISNSSSWNGPRLTKFMSTSISQALLRVNEWPKRDLFYEPYR